MFLLVFTLFDLGYMHFAPPAVSVLAALLFFFVILNHIREEGDEDDTVTRPTPAGRRIIQPVPAR